MYNRLLAAFGPSEGWPGNMVEIMATAVMVQNTAWMAVVRGMERFPHELTAEYLQAHDLTDLIDVVNTVPPLHTPFVPRNSIVREFVGGSCYEY